MIFFFFKLLTRSDKNPETDTKKRHPTSSLTSFLHYSSLSYIIPDSDSGSSKSTTPTLAPSKSYHTKFNSDSLQVFTHNDDKKKLNINKDATGNKNKIIGTIAHTNSKMEPNNTSQNTDNLEVKKLNYTGKNKYSNHFFFELL